MRIKHGLAAAALLAILGISAYWAIAQQPVNATAEQQTNGGFIPGEKRAPVDPAQVARGKALFEVSCQGCHGKDLRGGDMGGPNLLRSQAALTDKDGEMIVPIIQGSRQSMGMPNIGLSTEDAKAVAAYVRSVIGTIGRQGRPPGEEKPLNIVVGDPAAGKAYFVAKCQSCHSPEGDLQGIASRVKDPKALQNLWVAGEARGQSDPKAMPTAVVTLPSGENIEGRLIRIDDFLVTLKLSDGSTRTFERMGDMPKVAVHDPLQVHKEMLPMYTDKDMHNVTAYLVTLK